MLEIRENCEQCEKVLLNDSDEAMICTYECTFCMDCVKNVLFNVCPNCGGGFEKRPTRPKSGLAKHPPRKDKVICPVDKKIFSEILEKNKNIPPRER